MIPRYIRHMIQSIGTRRRSIVSIAVRLLFTSVLPAMPPNSVGAIMRLRGKIHATTQAWLNDFRSLAGSWKALVAAMCSTKLLALFIPEHLGC